MNKLDMLPEAYIQWVIAATRRSSLAGGAFVAVTILTLVLAGLVTPANTVLVGLVTASAVYNRWVYVQYRRNPAHPQVTHPNWVGVGVTLGTVVCYTAIAPGIGVVYLVALAVTGVVNLITLLRT